MNEKDLPPGVTAIPNKTPFFEAMQDLAKMQPNNSFRGKLRRFIHKVFGWRYWSRWEQARYAQAILHMFQQESAERYHMDSVLAQQLNKLTILMTQNRVDNDRDDDDVAFR